MIRKPGLVGLIAFAVAAFSACTTPVYEKKVVSRYDAGGDLLWTEVHESIRQADPATSPMKVKLTKRSELEK